MASTRRAIAARSERLSQDPPPTAELRPPRTPPWKLALRLVGPLLLVWVLTKVDLRQAAGALRHTAAIDIAAAFGLAAVLLSVKAFRWHRLLHKLEFRETFATSLLVFGEATFWGTLTPGRIGEFYKIVHLNRRHQIGWMRGAWLNVLDRGFDVLAILLVFTAACLQLPPALRDRFRPTWIVAATIALLAAILLKGLWCGPLLEWARSSTGRMRRAVAAVLADASRLSPAALVELTMYSVASLFFYVCMIYVLKRNLPFELSFAQTALCVVTTMLAGLLPVSYFNLGTREIVLIGLFGAFGLSSDNALSLSLLFLVCYLIVISITAIFWLLARRALHSAVASQETQNATSR